MKHTCPRCGVNYYCKGDITITNYCESHPQGCGACKTKEWNVWRVARGLDKLTCFQEEIAN